MSNPNDPYVERTVIEQPAVVRREVEPASRGGSAGWWIAALVAVVAIFGAVALVNSRNATDMQAAREAGRTEAMVTSATADAQRAASAATGAATAAATSAADSASRAAEATAENARQAAAASAADTGADASTTTPAEPAQ